MKFVQWGSKSLASPSAMVRRSANYDINPWVYLSIVLSLFDSIENIDAYFWLTLLLNTLLLVFLWVDEVSFDPILPESIFLLLHLCKDLAAALLVLLDIVDDGDHDGLVALQLVGNRPLQLVVGCVHVVHHPSQR